ncbi:hypothetical protein EVAR_81664_1 [Eumeta japonica]|uniref:Uncharacterized protein n=1 Tax=Eumeta variegata TaxID=151549 RepID=A0A4C1V3R8_EUMVA|nr:hypothetical protein EVAR_81664_1 [Eumeta japonica]
MLDGYSILPMQGKETIPYQVPVSVEGHGLNTFRRQPELSVRGYRHDGAMAHSPVEVETWLKDMFENNCIARYGPRRSPPRAPDLTPRDFFLWSVIKI